MRTILILATLACAAPAFAQNYPVSGRWGESNTSDKGPIDCSGKRVIGFTGAAHSYPGHADLLTEAGAETVIRRWSDLKGVLDALSQWSEA